MTMSESKTRFPLIKIVGGPEPSSLEIYRNGELQTAITEFQINGSMDGPVTAIFKEIVQFDGSVEVLPARKTGSPSH